jgi:IS66 C-terminal element
MYSLIIMAKPNDLDPRAWLADVLARIADHPASRLSELLPWHWARAKRAALAAPMLVSQWFIDRPSSISRDRVLTASV